jgi:branched-chain amino acid transport system substrate-binding protein
VEQKGLKILFQGRFSKTGGNAQMKVKSGITKILLALVLVLVLLCGACSQTPTATGPAPDTIKIGAAIAITGGQSAGGAQIKAGYECAVEAINKAGGVYVSAYDKKIPLELVVLDDQSDPTKTVSQLEVLYSQNNVIAYLGSMSSALNVAGCAIGEKNKVPWLGISFACMAPHKQGYKYVFSPFAKSPDFISRINRPRPLFS